MCLISIGPKGTEKTGIALASFIKQGMESNTDGSGCCWKKDKTKYVSLKKGFRKPEDLIEFIDSLKLTIDDEIIIHHRIGTSGEKNDVNMHPFVVSRDVIKLQAIEGKFKHPIMAHNGIFGFYSDYYSKFSDTYHFVEKFMSNRNILNILKEDVNYFMDLFRGSQIQSNKLAFLFPDRDLITIGNFTEDSGYLHSNSGYKKYEYNYGGLNDRMSNFNKKYAEIQDRITAKKNKKKHFSYESTVLVGEKHLEQAQDDSLNSRKAALKFHPSVLTINENNYNHFMYQAKFDYGRIVEANLCYILTDWFGVDDASYDCIQKVGFSKISYSIDFNKNFYPNNCLSVLVKPAYRERYENLFKIVDYQRKLNLERDNQNIWKPSKSCLKGINTILDKRKHKPNDFLIKLKEWGEIRKDVLMNYYNSVSETQFITIISDALINLNNKQLNEIKQLSDNFDIVQND